MVFKQNKLSYESDDSISCQLAFHHMKQVESENQSVTLTCMHFPEKKLILDGCSPDENKKNSCKAVKLENSKRHLDEEENLEASAKRIKQLDEEFSIFSEPSFSNFLTDDTSIKDTSNSKRSCNSHDESFSFPSLTCSGFEDYSARYDSPRISSFPEYYDDYYRPVVYNNQVEEDQPSIFDYRPRKPVAIGRNHQAELPSLTPKTSWACNEITEISTEKSSSSHCNPSCHCLDAGSIRCVRQHIKEARENLESSEGHERLIELGLIEMGESVALKWTDKEESLFHKVVFSNPVSIGRNFWNELYCAFPSRSGKEIVSYYFNVYMLRKRAEQNRIDPSNVDSDNDEWQLDDDEEDDNEKDDSAVESPEDGYAWAYSGAYICDDSDDKHEDYGDSECGATKVESPEVGYAWAYSGAYICDDSDDKNEDYGDSECGDTKVNQDANDDSCTSYEDLPNAHQNDVLDHGLSCMDGHGFFSEHCGHIPWDMMNYASSMDKEPDLLPTCNVVEQFGNGTWE